MSEFEFKNKGYGKYWVKLLHRDRNGSTHSIKEYEVSTLITLDSDKDYLQVWKSNKLNLIYKSSQVFEFPAKVPRKFAYRLPFSFF